MCVLSPLCVHTIRQHVNPHLFFAALLVLTLSACAGTPKLAGTPEAAQPLEDVQLLPAIGKADTAPMQFTCPEYNSVTNHKLVPNCVPPALLDAKYFGSDGIAKKTYKFEYAASQRPIGLALSGGGQKAASYAIGVLRGLHGIKGAWKAPVAQLINLPSALIAKVGAVSSVSGGSYAALWYFARLGGYTDQRLREGEEEKAGVPFESVFSDCLPRSYEIYESKNNGALCPNLNSNLQRYGFEASEDPYRFQNQLRGFADLFSKNFDYSREPKATSSLLKEIFWTLPTIPYNLALRGVFNFKNVQTSISAFRYFRNIERTYGLAPTEMNDERLSTLDPKDRFAPNRNAERGQTFAQLATLYLFRQQLCKHVDACDYPNIPLWIANTTAETFPKSSLSNIRADIEDSVFQFTPFRHGSRHYGHWKGTPRAADIGQIAGASGAFVNSMKWGGLQRALAAGAMSAFNARWSYMLPNPLWKDSVRTVHKFLPFPLWVAHRSSGNYRSAWIRLADGGQSENFGALALIQRGYRELILADQGEDQDGSFQDLCELRKNLSYRNLYLNMPYLKNFPEVCAARTKISIDLWDWHYPVQLGCVTRDKKNTRCDYSDIGGTTTSSVASKDYFARVYLLKPALPKLVVELTETCGQQMLLAANQLHKKNVPAVDAESDCAALFLNLREKWGYETFPAELFGFLTKNVTVRAGKDKHLLFPQHSTFSLTLNSSPFVFGAYRELAAWQTSKIAPLRTCLELEKDPAKCIELQIHRSVTANNDPL